MSFRPPLTPVERGLIGHALKSGVGGFDDPGTRWKCERSLALRRAMADLAIMRALPTTCLKCGNNCFDLTSGRAKCSACGEAV